MLRKVDIVVVVPEHSVFLHTIFSKGVSRYQHKRGENRFYSRRTHQSSKTAHDAGFVSISSNQQNPGFSLNNFPVGFDGAGHFPSRQRLRQFICAWQGPNPCILHAKMSCRPITWCDNASRASVYAGECLVMFMRVVSCSICRHERGRMP